MLQAKINDREFTKMIRQLDDSVTKKAWADTGKFFVKNTPVAEGNARRNTRVSDTEIRADYPYAGRLDEGYSRQAPDGISKPSLEYLEKQIDSAVRKL